MKRLAFVPRDSLLSALNLFVTEVRQVKPPVKHLHLTSQISSRISPEDLHSSLAQTSCQEGKNALDLIPLSAVCANRLIPWQGTHVDNYKMMFPIFLYFSDSLPLLEQVAYELLCLSPSLWWTMCLVLLLAQHVWWCLLKELTDINWTWNKGNHRNWH